MGAHEQQLQPFIWKFCRQRKFLLVVSSEEEKRRLARQYDLLMPHTINHRMPCRRQEPGRRIAWHPVSWPHSECGHERIAERVFGTRHIARVRGKIGDQSTIGL